MTKKLDTNVKAKYDVPMWSETRWGGCYNPKEGVGLFLHAGRLRGNLDWWWVQTAIYLPGERVAVERSWVKNPDEMGVNTPSLVLRTAEIGWSARFEGVTELTTIEELGKAPRGSGAPSVPAQFELVADGSRPWWDMATFLTGKPDFAEVHVEQLGHCKGTLQIGKESYRLDGISYYDHSSGVRDWTHFHSHHFGLIAMPDCTIHTIGVYASATEQREPIGVLFSKDGQAHKIEMSTMPRLTSVVGAPLQFDWVFKAEGSEKVTYRVEILHSFPCSTTFNNDNINGIAWDAAGDPLFLVECQVKVTAPDGTVGYGHIERSNRKSVFLGG